MTALAPKLAAFLCSFTSMGRHRSLLGGGSATIGPVARRRLTAVTPFPPQMLALLPLLLAAASAGWR